MSGVNRGGFSLVEVVIAVGIFGIAVAAIIGVLPMLTRQAGTSAEAYTAEGMADAVRVELTRLSKRGFDALATRMPEMDGASADGLLMVAARDGQRLHALDYFPPPPAERLPEDDQFFLIEIWRFNTPPLLYSTNGSLLPVYVRVSWPYRVPGAAAPVALGQRNQFTFSVAINR